MTEDPDDLRRWRSETPGCQSRIHLNNAGAALMPQPVLDAVLGHLRLESEIGGYEAADQRASAIAQTYASVAELIGAQPRNVAVVENATAAFALALSSFDFRPGDVILTSRNDYVSNQIMYLSLARRLRIEIHRANDLPDGGIDPDSVKSFLARRRPTLVAVTHMPTNSGLVQDVERVGEICAEAGVPYLVDACQSVGQLPVDVQRIRCDFLSVTGRKFLRGPRGVGFLYVSDDRLRAVHNPCWWTCGARNGPLPTSTRSWTERSGSRTGNSPTPCTWAWARLPATPWTWGSTGRATGRAPWRPTHASGWGASTACACWIAARGSAPS